MAIVGVLAMAGCGGDDGSDTAAVERPAEPVLCPSQDQGATGESGAFDAREILGMTQADAEQQAEQRGCTVRVTVDDGQELAQTMDLRTDRINVELRDGTVVALRGVG